MMGYYINIQESDFLIPTHNLDKALERFKALNHKEGVEKHGGAWTPGEGKTTSWFSWMPADYDEIVTSAEEVLQMLGFDTYTDERGLVICGYDSKIGQEELFLNEIRDLVDVSCYIIWRGEDGEVWKWTPRGIYEGRVIFDESSRR